MSIKIKGYKTSIHEAFYGTLTDSSDSLALSQLWVCAIDKKVLTKIATRITSDLPEYETKEWVSAGTLTFDKSSKSGWITIDPIENATGGAMDVFLWISGISFIGDGISSSRVGVQQSGASKGLISENRNEFTTAKITFLESNVSFVDGILRPWSVLVGYKSLKDPELRCNIELFALEKTGLTTSFKIRKSILLRNAVPVSIDAEEYNYSGAKLIERGIEFAFDRYDIRIDPWVDYVDETQKIKDSVEKKIIKPMYQNKNDKLTLNGPTEVIISPPKYISSEKELTTEDQNRKALVPKPTEPSLLQQIKDIVGKAQSAVNTAKGIADTTTSAVAQGLNATGLSNTANKVSNINNRFQSKVITPTANVLSTGTNRIAGAQNIGAAFGTVTGTKIL